MMMYFAGLKRHMGLILCCVAAGLTVCASHALAAAPVPRNADAQTTSAVHYNVMKPLGGTQGLRRQPATLTELVTSRPALAVGTLKDIDTTNSTVRLSIDRKLSSLPHIILYQAQNAKLSKELLEREFPTERSFRLRPGTLLLDARPDPNRPQTKAVTGKMSQDKQRIPLSAFKPGERVGVLYRMNPDPKQDIWAITFSKLDPNATSFPLEIGPRASRFFKRNGQKAVPPASATKAADRPTTR